MRRKKIFLAAVPGILGALLVLASAYKYGPAISTDSVAYVYAAESLLAGKGYVYFGYEAPFIQWPPLFPTFLAALAAPGVDVVPGAMYMNAAVFGLIIFFSGLWLCRNTERHFFALIGTFAAMVSIPVFKVSKFIWSEPLFIFFIILFFIEIESFTKTGKHRHLFLASAFTALACLTRYAGIAVILTGLLVIMLQKKRIAERLAELVIFGFVSALPLSLWIVRNYVVSSTLLGARTPSNYTFMQNVGFVLYTVASWFFPLGALAGAAGSGKLSAFTIIVSAAIALFIGVGVAAALVNRRTGRYGCLTGMVASGSFVVIYTGYLTISATSVAFDTIDDRLLAPVFVPITFLIFTGADHIAQMMMEGIRAKRTAVHVLAALMCIWLVYPASGVLADVRSSIRKGAGVFSTDAWHNSPLINYLKEARLDGQIYSNYPDAIYAVVRIPARYTPKKDSLPIYGFRQFEKAVKEGKGSYIVWFNKNTSNSIYNVEELRPYFTIEKIAGLEDGEVYAVK